MKGKRNWENGKEKVKQERGKGRERREGESRKMGRGI